MARRDTVYACGCPGRTRGYRNYETQAAEHAARKCDTCWAEDRRRALAEASANDAAWAAAEGLPELRGSDKQVAWAQTIRRDRLAEVDREIRGWQARLEEELSDPFLDEPDVAVTRRRIKVLQAVQETIREATQARWWIDTRDALITGDAFGRWPTVPLATDEQRAAGFKPLGDNTVPVPHDEVIEVREKSLLVALRHSRWEGCTVTHPLSMATEQEGGSWELRFPGQWAFEISDGRRRETVSAAEMFMDRTAERSTAPNAPYATPNVYRAGDWNSFDVPTADVHRDDGAASVTVTLVRSRWEGLHFTHPASLVTDHPDGTSTIRFSDDWEFTLRGGERALPVSRRELWQDRTQPLAEPGPSQAVAPRTWTELVFSPNRVKRVKAKEGQKAAVYVKFPWDTATPDAVVFHPASMTVDGHVWRFHDAWEFRMKYDDEVVNLTAAEFVAAVEGWATRDTSDDPVEYTPELLEPTEVEIPEELIYRKESAA